VTILIQLAYRASSRRSRFVAGDKMHYLAWSLPTFHQRVSPSSSVWSRTRGRIVFSHSRIPREVFLGAANCYHTPGQGRCVVLGKRNIQSLEPPAPTSQPLHANRGCPPILVKQRSLVRPHRAIHRPVLKYSSVRGPDQLCLKVHPQLAVTASRTSRYDACSTIAPLYYLIIT
jgi:hypothetical protein